MLPQPNPAYYQAPPPPPARYAARPEWDDLDAEEEAEYRAPPAPKASYRILGQ
jgi:hypothetical protein